MRLRAAPALLSVACIALVGCRFPGTGGGAAPTGQVVATVDGHEVTLRELQAELAGVRMPTDPKAQKAVQQRALQLMIARELLANAARTQGLDKTPEFALLRARAEETLLAQTLEMNLSRQVPAPTREEAASFVSNHPDIFAQRKIYTVDQIRVGQITDPNVMRQIQPLNTLPEIEAVLTAAHLDYRRATDTLDVVGVDPQLVDQIVKLPGEVFVIPVGGGVTINQIKDTKILPFTGEPAIVYATALLKRQHTQEAVTRQLSQIVAKGATTVRYNPAFQPPKPSPHPTTAPAASAPAGAAPAAPAKPAT